MPTVGDFTVIEPSAFTLNPAAQTVQQILFNLPVSLDTSARALLVYKAAPASNATGLEWRIDINNDRIESYELLGKAFRSVNEAVPAGTLQPGGNNLTFEVSTAGSGDLVISDVALLWQNNI